MNRSDTVDKSQVSDTQPASDARPVTLANLRVPEQVVKDANYIASRLAMRQREVVAKIIAQLRRYVEISVAKHRTAEQMRGAIFEGVKDQKQWDTITDLLKRIEELEGNQ